MHSYERTYLQQLKNRIAGQRMFIQIVYGPRQVGKTTLVRQLLKQLDIDSLFFPADNVPAVDSNWVKRVWDEARLKLALFYYDLRYKGSEMKIYISKV